MSCECFSDLPGRTVSDIRDVFSNLKVGCLFVSCSYTLCLHVLQPICQVITAELEEAFLATTALSLSCFLSLFRVDASETLQIVSVTT